MITKGQTHFLNQVCPGCWIEDNDIIDVEWNANFSGMNLTEFPVQFGKAKKNFLCSNNQLTTLRCTPNTISGGFGCDNNSLTTLIDGPKEVGGHYICKHNLLTNLIGAPNICAGFNCNLNLLTSLEGGPKEVSGQFSCATNLLTTLIGSPEICNGDFSCQENNLTSLEGCPRIIKGNLHCSDNPNLHILYGIGRVIGTVEYDQVNDLNEWIIEQARKDIFVQYDDIANWIKDNDRLEFLLHAQQEVCQHFSPIILCKI